MAEFEVWRESLLNSAKYTKQNLLSSDLQFSQMGRFTNKFFRENF